MSSIGNLSSGGSDLAAYLNKKQQHGPGDMFDKIDADGDGKISKSELETAFTQAGGTADQADKLFAKLDKDGDGSVSKADFVSGLRAMHHGHHHHQTDAAAAAPTDPSADDDTTADDASRSGISIVV
jgi:Ca2+-binding EF-hand superfamily protein